MIKSKCNTLDSMHVSLPKFRFILYKLLIALISFLSFKMPQILLLGIGSTLLPPIAFYIAVPCRHFRFCLWPQLPHLYCFQIVFFLFLRYMFNVSVFVSSHIILYFHYISTFLLCLPPLLVDVHL